MSAVDDYVPESGEEEDARVADADDHDADTPHASPTHEGSRQRPGNASQKRLIFKDAQGDAMRFFFRSGVQQSSKRRLTQRIIVRSFCALRILSETLTGAYSLGPRWSSRLRRERRQRPACWASIH